MKEFRLGKAGGGLYLHILKLYLGCRNVFKYLVQKDLNLTRLLANLGKTK